MRFDALDYAFELLEYKADDLRNRRPIRGGTDSLWALLRDVEERADRLDAPRAERLSALRRELGERPVAVHGAGRDPLQPRRLEGLLLGAAGGGGEATSAGGGEAGGCDRDAPEPTAGQLPGPSALRAQVALSADDDEAPTPSPGASPAEVSAAFAAEREALRRLSRRVSIRGVQSFAASVAAMWQVDNERVVPRVLYATLRNLERFRATPSFATDATLRTFVVREPVPGPRDPVAELREPMVLYDLVQRTVEAVLDLGARAVTPPIERSASLDYLQRLARAVAVDPRTSSSHAPASGGPSVGELRAELRDVERYRLPEWEKALRRAELQERLRMQEAVERSGNQAQREDAPRYRSAVDGFMVGLARVLPPSVGGRASERDLARDGVAFAHDPLLRRGSQDARRYAFTLCAEQSTTFTLDEDPAVVSVHDGERILHWRGCDVVLDVDRVTQVGSVDLETFVEGAYVHGVVRLRPSTLVARILEVAAALPVLGEADADKRVASLAPASEDVTQDPVDRVLQATRRLAREASERTDPEGYVSSIVRQRLKHAELATEGDWITRFARGVSTVARASETSFEAALAALGVHASPPVGEAPVVVPLRPEPIQVRISGQVWIVRSVCVRDVEHVRLQHPSSFIAAFQDQLVVPFMGGVLVGVRDAGQVVAMHLPNLEIEAVADVSLV